MDFGLFSGPLLVATIVAPFVFFWGLGVLFPNLAKMFEDLRASDIDGHTAGLIAWIVWAGSWMALFFGLYNGWAIQVFILLAVSFGCTALALAKNGLRWARQRR